MITVDFNRIHLPRNARILDIGCGEGRHTIRAAQEKNTCCVGADFDFPSLAQTRNKLAFHRAIDDLNCRSVDLSCMDITAMPFGDQSFDLVICSEVLEHIPDDTRAITELARIVKPGQILAVSVPRTWPERICWMLSDTYANTPGGHIRIYNKNRLIQAVEKSGFTLFDTHHAHSIHAPYWWLKCLLGETREDAVPVNLYHRFLVWDLMQQPRLTRVLDTLFNPLMGKSLVLYFRKNRA